MSIRQFEIFHGIALTKLIRSEKPVSVSLIETKPAEDWQVYGIIDIDLFVKHRTKSNSQVRKKGRQSWQFIFSQGEISRINKRGRPVYVALICGHQSIQEEMEICFLKPEQVREVFPSDADKPFSLTVRSEPGNSLWVFVHRQVRIKVPRSAIEKWEIPGR